jgi:hypothetical protein
MFRRTNWVKAKGRVVAVDRHSTTMDEGVPGSYDTGYVVDVQPTDGAPFRAKVDPAGHHIGSFTIESFDFKHPNEGDVVSLEYDPDTKKVRFDMSDPALHRKASREAESAAAHARYEDALNAPVGEKPPPPETDLNSD